MLTCRIEAKREGGLKGTLWWGVTVRWLVGRFRKIRGREKRGGGWCHALAALLLVLGRRALGFVGPKRGEIERLRQSLLGVFF